MPEGVVHIVGAGLAGLSTALRLASAGQKVRIWEASGHAGGRCRSFDEPRLGRRIDNGNHLVLSGNGSVQAYLALAGASDALKAAPEAEFPFVDIKSGKRWTVRMNKGRLPWWITSESRRIPDTTTWDYLCGFGLALAGDNTTVAEAVRGRGPLWQRFWEPITLAVLNTTPEKGAAPLLWRVMKETFVRGEAHCRPMFAPDGLGDALVDPALARLAALGAEITYFAPLKAISDEDGRATSLHLSDGRVEYLGPKDRVVIALPPARLGNVMPDLDLPRDEHAILNAHFVVPDRALLKDAPPFMGVVNSKTHWIFVRGDVVSLTISAADQMEVLGGDRAALLDLLWEETRKALNLGEIPYQAGRILTERRATFDQSPSGVAKRPEASTALHNVFLAGDATNTGLPATIEGAIRSGETAARLAA
ncbi:hydroxysqualene dehydroxylase HpnE [Rhodobacteraceae bacterium NNCM2]|nr:hydroxysqualene dehydroxylase HpnE [Coraliihabitans acroporae]